MENEKQKQETDHRNQVLGWLLKTQRFAFWARENCLTSRPTEAERSLLHETESTIHDQDKKSESQGVKTRDSWKWQMKTPGALRLVRTLKGGIWEQVLLFFAWICTSLCFLHVWLRSYFAQPLSAWLQLTCASEWVNGKPDSFYGWSLGKGVFKLLTRLGGSVMVLGPRTAGLWGTTSEKGYHQGICMPAMSLKTRDSVWSLPRPRGDEKHMNPVFVQQGRACHGEWQLQRSLLF